MRNQLISFRILDAYHPRPEELLLQLHGEDLLQGIVLMVSPGASPAKHYAVVHVKGLVSPVIVELNPENPHIQTLDDVVEARE